MEDSTPGVTRPIFLRMRYTPAPHVVLTILVVGAIACADTSRVDAADLQQTASGPGLRVAILGDPSDPRVAPVREAIAHWNGELRRLGRTVQLDSGIMRDPTIPDSLLRAASGGAVRGFGSGIAQLRARLADMPADIVIALSTTDLISFGMPWRRDRPGVVVLRRSDIPPLSMPNTVRNVVAHEIGHILGLSHNRDSTTLMCGRPAPCRPAAFASDSARFFPFTAEDEERLRKRWP